MEQEGLLRAEQDEPGLILTAFCAAFTPHVRLGIVPNGMDVSAVCVATLFYIGFLSNAHFWLIGLYIYADGSVRLYVGTAVLCVICYH